MMSCDVVLLCTISGKTCLPGAHLQQCLLRDEEGRPAADLSRCGGKEADHKHRIIILLQLVRPNPALLQTHFQQPPCSRRACVRWQRLSVLGWLVSKACRATGCRQTARVAASLVCASIAKRRRSKPVIVLRLPPESLPSGDASRTSSIPAPLEGAGCSLILLPPLGVAGQAPPCSSVAQHHMRLVSIGLLPPSDSCCMLCGAQHTHSVCLHDH